MSQNTINLPSKNNFLIVLRLFLLTTLSFLFYSGFMESVEQSKIKEIQIEQGMNLQKFIERSVSENIDIRFRSKQGDDFIDAKINDLIIEVRRLREDVEKIKNSQ